jgi:hypothetical protein
MDGFDGRSNGFGVWLGPVKAAGEPLQKIVNAAGFERTLGVLGRLLLPIISFGFLRTAGIGDLGHGNLMVMVAIVGEVAG